MRFLAFIFGLFFASASIADVIVPVKTIRANTILTELDVKLNRGVQGPGVDRLEDVVGMETRVVLYAGRPIQAENVGPPAVVSRNQLVPLLFDAAGLSISTMGRALDRGAAGDSVRVMNVASRATLFGTVMPNGSIRVSGN